MNDIFDAKLSHQNLNDRTYLRLKAGLIAGTFRPGEPFVIRPLAERLGISTTPVREALQRLVTERLLVMLPNRSIVVPTLSSDEFAEIYRIRGELEGLSAELALPHLKSVDVTHLKRQIGIMDKAIKRGDKTLYREANQLFHFMIYERADSPQLLEMIRTLWGQVGPVFYGLLDDPDYDGNEQHRQIIEAIEARDAAALRRCVAEDIATAGRTIAPRLNALVADES
ncbi:GntR family transcriptional regulator [Paraburkholderia tropica]|uniref:Transcriptional regulator, GntR family n=1 Tax=Paraburkholderia tropica TaxID=92647 RepID=A0AAQ1GK74_9BURK|nr:GntR family transcriptional regulator [Paraburkholderia tropica]RQN38189.1 GntR family transcriptional regulator [Paraburkholderia tropica]SEK07785.1 transcriptional regulator, GntR family [Paraburkholderia tropica]